MKEPQTFPVISLSVYYFFYYFEERKCTNKPLASSERIEFLMELAYESYE